MSADLSQPAGSRARAVIGIVIAATVLAVVLGVVLLTGGIRLPDYPALGPSSGVALEGTLAVAVQESHEDPACIHVIDTATGADRELACVGTWVSALRWDRDGHIVVWADDGFGEIERQVIDPADGTIIDIGASHHSAHRRTGPTGVTERSDGARLAAGWRSRDDDAGVRLREADGTERLLLASPNPRTYRFTEATWAPDQRHVLIGDDADRHLLLDTVTGDVALVTEDATHLAWRP